MYTLLMENSQAVAHSGQTIILVWYLEVRLAGQNSQLKSAVDVSQIAELNGTSVISSAKIFLFCLA